MANSLHIGKLSLRSRVLVAPMSGVTDLPFRRILSRFAPGAVVSEMIAGEGLSKDDPENVARAAGSDDIRPMAVQLVGRDPHWMEEGAKKLEAAGAELIDINFGCPARKVVTGMSGSALMREPDLARSIVEAVVEAVSVPVTVKMRAGWDDDHVNAPTMAGLMEQSGAAGVAVHGRTAKQSYTGRSDWSLIDEVARRVSIPVFGSGDCVAPEDVVERLKETAVAGVLVGRGALRNPWIFEQAARLAQGGTKGSVGPTERGCFLLAYIDLLLSEGTSEARGFRHHAIPALEAGTRRRGAASCERWVVNKVRALGSWYTKGVDNGSRLRKAINHAGSINELRIIIHEFFEATEEMPLAFPKATHEIAEAGSL